MDLAEERARTKMLGRLKIMMHVKQCFVKCNEGLPLFILQAKDDNGLKRFSTCSRLAKTGFLAVVQSVVFVPMVDGKRRASGRKHANEGRKI